MLILRVCVMITLRVAVHAEIEKLIIGGNYALIHKYPHSAFIHITCIYPSGSSATFACGSSILNQRLLLTAGHCFHTCNSTTRATVNVGSEHRERGSLAYVSGFMIHGKFQPTTLYHDIALVKLAQELMFGKNVKRIVLMKTPPYDEQAYVAGWGFTGGGAGTKVASVLLKELDQKLMKNSKCLRIFGGNLPRGTICATSAVMGDAAAPGDSGSALVVRDHIQIGLVSFKRPGKFGHIIMYTDVGYYYEWIVKSANKLFCEIIT